MINFRVWISEEDESVMGSSIERLNSGFMGSKEKFDIEIGKSGKDGDIRLPDILQNLDYSGFEDSLKKKGGEGVVAFDPFFPPATTDHQVPKYSPRCSNDKRNQ